ncbi:hypothetical protein [Novosphingobium sp. HII-3]|uniref:hypothetical protein n=1 Tax=Novosphingobium sp. HII-3 TaxID=2075565 RepID=UPI000CDAC9BF|nr:hypothetical protein [Novosphingobium sp. HII-3]
MRTERLDLRVYRNADYYEGWQLRDSVGVPLDLTGVAMALSIRAVAGQGAVIASGEVDIYDAAHGMFTVKIDGAALASVAGPGEIVRLAYDLRVTYPDGVQAIPVAGQIILTPGVTY